jgi:phosphopantothenate---cysteine ligase (CTP)
MKKILITSGGTREYIDDVRVLTNISSGKLGANIANYFLKQNIIERHKEHDIKYQIHYVSSNTSEKPHLINRTFIVSEYKQYNVTDVQSVYTLMEELVPQMDIVIHCMAVSDFGFKPCSTKLKSSDPLAFIDSLKDRIYKTPKILPMIKKWNPNCKLVSFKFEVNLPHEELIQIAKDSMLSGGSDIVIANDKTEMVNNKSHIAYGLYNNEEVKLNSKDEISEFLYDLLKSMI